MAKPKCNEDDFIRLWHELGGAAAVARELGCSERAVHERRRAVEKRRAITLDAGSAIGGKANAVHSEASAAVPFEVADIPSGELPIAELLQQRCRRFSVRAVHEQAARLRDVRIKLDGPFGLFWFGDEHLDDDGTNLPELMRHVELIKRTDGLLACSVGDHINNWAGRLARLYSEQSTSARDAWRLAEWYLRELQWLIRDNGNHMDWSGAGDPVRYIVDTATGVHGNGEACVRLHTPVGEAFTLKLRHKWPGHSMWNTVHAISRAAQMGERYDILVGGHTHVTGYAKIKHRDGLLTHCVQVASYKEFDRYAAELGLPDKAISPCAVIVINPYATSRAGMIHIYDDPDEGVAVLNALRQRWKAERKAA